ncbi:MAG: carbohydrate ABC transporter permease [Defluviitaleaceae bacterium]|nr:carbohydrate ABC transporter permease [Defluviitaleaceae bacterium]MCL2262926.1 carbohydrate ABC transporter permease [Defluviitaleaceae bacterium]
MNIGLKIAKGFIYVLCVTLTILSILPFLIMFVNSTRSTPQIQQNALSFAPSTFLMDNYRHMMGYVSMPVLDESGNQILDQDNRPLMRYERVIERAFNPFIGFRNSLIVSIGVTLLAIYFSSLTAYANVAYDWKFKKALFVFILFVMMIPAQVSVIGFFQFAFRVGWANTFWPLILPSIASPTIVFFMRQYMLASLPLDIIEAARIDGAKEFFTFNRIIMPILKPAIATQAIFVFVGSWNNLFLPSILLTANEMRTMPVMVQLLRGDIYDTVLGAQYLGLAMTVLPLFIVYFMLSKYIIAGVAIGGVKDE